ncbi:MAG: dienelactone hydrolase [Arenicella sp.]|jgi:dienelactone hydrolase
MKLAKPLFLLGLLTVLMSSALYAKEATSISQPLDQAYLAHWFSYDTAEPIELALNPLAADALGERAEIRFTSDDGQAVNGLIGFPKDRASSKKLALALHPMGIDQQFWWSEKSPLAAQKMTARLRQQGYTVISLDARQHGERGRQGFGPRELIKRAHSAEPRLYIDTIVGSVRDYRIALNWAKNEFDPDQVLVMGYSMGAQMSLLLASFEPSVSTIVAIVPPYIGSPTSPVAPRIHVQRITDAKVLWLAGSQDPHSDRDQTQETFDQISSSDKTLTWFVAGHRLPPEFLDTALSFFDSLQLGSE